MTTGIIMKDILEGPNAFYQAADYAQTLSQELNSKKQIDQITYRCRLESKIWRIAKELLSIIIFPIGIYQLIHRLIARLVLPATTRSRDELLPISYDSSSDWKVKRIAVEVDGYIVDGAIIGQASTLGNGRWVLAANGNGELYEDKFGNRDFKDMLTPLNSNALIFNYPCVGSSTGGPSRDAMAKAYRAMLHFLEDQEKGIAAKEIIGYGYSIGGGAQGDALASHRLKSDVKYVFVFSQTFSDLSTIASDLTNRLFGFLVKVFGWNMGSVVSSKKLKAPEIIMQKAAVSDYTDISGSPELIQFDGVITANASLAKALLLDPNCPRDNKYFMGMPEHHNYQLKDPSYLANKIEEMLQAYLLS